MKVTYSPQLMEEAVFRYLNHHERSGYRADYDEYHSLADPIYELPEDDREEAFEKVNRIFFVEKIKLGDHVLRALEAVGLIPKRQRTAKRAVSETPAIPQASIESPSSETDKAVPSNTPDSNNDENLVEVDPSSVSEVQEENEGKVTYDLAREFEERIQAVFVKRAINKVDEGSNVLSRTSNKPIIEMRVLASRFNNPEEAQELNAFLIHEFMHAKDMVDPEFDYEDAFIPGNPSVKNMITARFRLLWNIFVDSRLERMGVVSVLSKQARFREFDNFYRKIPEKQRKGIFEGLWLTEKFNHEELLSMATDLDTLMSKFVEVSEMGAEERDYIHLQGSPCPLCKFPTYNWVDDPESICDEMVIEAIQIDFPDWESKDGACDRCVEVYELRAGVG
ncbi:MAG: hypothetical protein O3A78_08540 [Nitrospinae bacterium]|nr:hypothetical protein [Nitrospinota bacterium]MDA1109847.1 hypothetical protein [Nitrospinota bacterium]